MSRITGVIFDWAGTTVDHGSVAPIRTLQKLFAAHGIPLSETEARRDMGIHKRDHIRKLLHAKLRRSPGDAMIEQFFAEFIPMQMDCLLSHSNVIAGVPEIAARLRSRGIRIGSTTGYTRTMLNTLLTHAAHQGYTPDAAVCPEDAGAGRPYPWMCYLTAMQMGTYPMHTMVKIGDTLSDVEEGLNAGMWTIGVARTGNMIGLTADGLAALPPAGQKVLVAAARGHLRDAGAHYVIDSVGDLDLEPIEQRLARGERP